MQGDSVHECVWSLCCRHSNRTPPPLSRLNSWSPQAAPGFSTNMAFRHGWRASREAYEKYYQPTDHRDAMPHRVVNIVNKRSGPQCPSYNFSDESWLDDHDDSWIPFDDGRWVSEDNSFGYEDRRHSSSFHRKSPPKRSDGGHSQHSYSRDDLRHQLNSRKNSRPHPYCHRGRGSKQRTGSSKGSRDNHDYRPAPSAGLKREQSPADARSGSVGRKSFSEDNKVHAPKTVESSGSKSLTGEPPSSSVEEESQQGTRSPQVDVPAEKKEEEVKVTSNEDFLSQRTEAIKAKAAEIEMSFRQDCETFRTVVKMLVSKQPSLDGLLQTSLDLNLHELKQRCLEAFKSFVSELDKVLKPPEGSA